MTPDCRFDDGVPTQDADLLARLNGYFDRLEQRLDQGQGWLIFNSSRERGARILRLLNARLDGYRPFVSLLHLPWRDFALHAYVSTVALPRLVAEDAAGPLHREVALASGVANATAHQLAHADLVILSGLNPATQSEALALSEAATARVAQGRAVIALTGHDPWSLAAAFDGADRSGTAWRRFYDAMYRANYIAH